MDYRLLAGTGVRLSTISLGTMMFGRGVNDNVEVDRKFDIVARLKSIAGDAGLTLPELAVGFVKAHPAVTSVLLGPRTLGQLGQLLTCADIDLSRDVRAAVDEVVPPGVDIDPSNFVRAGTGSESPA